MVACLFHTTFFTLPKSPLSGLYPLLYINQQVNRWIFSEPQNELYPFSRFQIFSHLFSECLYGLVCITPAEKQLETHQADCQSSRKPINLKTCEYHLLLKTVRDTHLKWLLKCLKNNLNKFLTVKLTLPVRLIVKNTVFVRAVCN